MKTRFVLLAFVIVSVSLHASFSYSRSIDSLEAVLVAEKKLNTLGNKLYFSLGTERKIASYGQILAYVFDLVPRGYIVVSASTGISPVIAYSFEARFGDLTRDNPLFEMVSADLIKRMQYDADPANTGRNIHEIQWKTLLDKDTGLSANPLFEQWPATGDGWLKTNWTQSPPYSNFCPMDPVTGLRSYAGCPATAMAQIMNFHQTTNNTHFDDSDDYYHNYAGRQYWIDDGYEFADFPAFPQLNIYLDTLNAHYMNNILPTNDDKAAMTFACGVAARQVFTSQGSGTFGVDQAHDAYLRFGCNTVDLLDSNDSDLYDRLKQNIKDTLPAHLAVVDSNWSTGHNVVVDGYNTEEYYHLNFGWGGSYNGWYLLPQEIPYELTVIEGVVLDIMKNNTIGIKVPETSITETFLFPNPAADIAFLYYRLCNKSSVIFCLFNNSGQEVLKIESKDQVPGRHSLSVPLEKQSAGVYFYTLQTSNSLNSGKIIRVE